MSGILGRIDGSRGEERMSRNTVHRITIAGLTTLTLLAARQPAAAQALPDAAEIVKKYVQAMGGETLREKPGMRTSGTFTMPAMGTSGPMEVAQARPNQLVLMMTLPGIGEMRSGFNGDVGWSLNPLEGPRLLTGKELVQLRDDADFAATLRAPHLIESMETVDAADVDGQACYRVRVLWKSGRETFDCYATDSGLLLATDLRTETVMGSVDATILFSEYREFDGVRLPTRTVQRVMGQEFVMTVDAVQFGPIDGSVFELPAEIKALVKG